MDIHRLSNTEQMEWLCEQFPSLRGAPGTTPWDALEFQDYFHGPAGTGGSRHAARFALNVWNNTEEWDIGPFNLSHAFGVWDAAHRAALLTWANDPWFP